MQSPQLSSAIQWHSRVLNYISKKLDSLIFEHSFPCTRANIHTAQAYIYANMDTCKYTYTLTRLVYFQYASVAQMNRRFNSCQ
jgi:hypothetical protein